MKLAGLGYCRYHDATVTAQLCAYKQGRCRDCEYLIPTEEFMTVEEAASLFKKSQASIRSWIRKGRIKAESYEFVEKYRNKTYRYQVYFMSHNMF